MKTPLLEFPAAAAVRRQADEVAGDQVAAGGVGEVHAVGEAGDRQALHGAAAAGEDQAVGAGTLPPLSWISITALSPLVERVLGDARAGCSR